MRNEHAPRRLAAWTASALSAVAALALAGLSWHWVLLGSALAAGYYYIVYRMCAMPLTKAAYLAFGRTAGGAVLALTFVWTVFAAGAAAALAADAYPEDDVTLLAPACVLLLAAWGGRRGTDTLARAAGALSLLLGLLYAALAAAAAAQAEAQWCRPWGGAEQAARTFVWLLPASAALYLPDAGRGGKRPGLFLALLAPAPAALACVTSGCLSAQAVQRTAAPFYAMSKSLRVFGVVERFEPVVSAALLAGVFALVSLLTQSAAETAHALCPRVPVCRCAPAVCALSLAASALSSRVPQTLLAGLAGIFWGVLPLITLGIVTVKKGGKNAKKGVDKPDSL